MVQHQEAERNFVVMQQNDNQNVGMYTITISSEISVPDDATKTSYTPYTVSYDFTIVIQPCAVNNFIASSEVLDLIQSVGAPS